MGQRFPISEFEHHFEDKVLEKGLRLYRKQHPILVERYSGHYNYELGGFHLALQMNVRGLVSGTCSCGKSLCPHLAAILFHQLSHQLGEQLSTPQRAANKKRSPFEE